MEARYDTILAPLNTHELLILGGKGGSVASCDEERANMFTTYTIFDTKTNQVVQVTDISRKLFGWVNQAVMGRDGNAIVLVFGPDSDTEASVFLVNRN